MSKMRPLVVSLDLEMNQPSGAIVQIGAAVGNLLTGEQVGLFEALVDPGEPLSPAISELCAIDPQDLRDNGVPLAEAYSRLVAFLEPHAQTRQLNPLTWGGGDSQALRTQLGVENEQWVFGRRWLDVKTVYIAWCAARGLNGTGGLSASMKKLKLKFEGRPHGAAADAWNTFRMYRALLQGISPSRGSAP